MLISERIPLDVEAVIREIRERQGLPWNNGRINEYSNYGILQKLFVYMNSGIPEEDFFYKGNLFRIHSSYVEHVSRVDSSREIIVSSSDDGSCSVLPVTEYSAALVSLFNKAFLCTDEGCKINSSIFKSSAFPHVFTVTIIN